MKQVVAFLSGTLFAVGLVVSGMTQPSKVVGFLDFFGAWDPSLACVMGGAVAVNALVYRVTLDRQRPLFDRRFHLPDRHQLDGRLIVGAVLFGVGWGLAGFCPGPAVVSAPSGGVDALAFGGAMLAGMAGYHGYEHIRHTWSSPASPDSPTPASDDLQLDSQLDSQS